MQSRWNNPSTGSATQPRSGVSTPPRLSLDEIDRAVVEALVREPSASTQELAQITGVSAATISRRLRRLTRTGVVRVIGRTAPGFGQRIARLVRVHGAPSELARLVEAVAALPSTTWGRLSRDRTELAFGSIVGAQHADRGLILATESAGTHVQVHELLRVWTEHEVVLTAPRHLDSLDLALLDALAEDGRASSAQLAERLGVDASTASRRRRRLVEEGVLYFEADVHPWALNTQGDHMCWLTVTPGSITRIGDRLHALDDVAYVAATSGASNLVVTTRASAGRGILELVETEFADQAVTGVEIVPMDHAVKLGHHPKLGPLPLERESAG